MEMSEASLTRFSWQRDAASLLPATTDWVEQLRPEALRLPLLLLLLVLLLLLLRMAAHVTSPLVVELRVYLPLLLPGR